MVSQAEAQSAKPVCVLSSIVVVQKQRQKQTHEQMAKQTIRHSQQRQVVPCLVVKGSHATHLLLSAVAVVAVIDVRVRVRSDARAKQHRDAQAQEEQQGQPRTDAQ